MKRLLVHPPSAEFMVCITTMILPEPLALELIVIAVPEQDVKKPKREF
jgi:hypothetical protein